MPSTVEHSLARHDDCEFRCFNLSNPKKQKDGMSRCRVQHLATTVCDRVWVVHPCHYGVRLQTLVVVA